MVKSKHTLLERKAAKQCLVRKKQDNMRAGNAKAWNSLSTKGYNSQGP